VDPEGALDTVAEYLLVRSPRREPTRCILCALCVRVCAQVPERHALSLSKRGIQRKAISPFGKVAETCIGCGSCVYVCPTKTVKVEEAG
jgi:NADH dehydrogenase/NADH:ubiquinone oxidoreductase subunit G